MLVQVRLFAHFRSRLPPEARGQTAVALTEGATIADLLAYLGIVEQVKLVTVNNRPAPNRERELRDGDSVRIFPAVVGG